MNFAAVDWVMSLEFPFHSTIFGPLMASTHLLSSALFFDSRTGLAVGHGRR